MTGHGFRGVASTILHEQGYEQEHIELQLAHQDRNEVSAAYNYAKYLVPRAKMMQKWADYRDIARTGKVPAKTVEIYPTRARRRRNRASSTIAKLAPNVPFRKSRTDAVALESRLNRTRRVAMTSEEVERGSPSSRANS